MATLATAARNAAANAIVDLLDVGSAVTYPYISFCTSGDVEVARCNFTGTTAFGAANTGVCTAGTIADDTDADGGIIATGYVYLKDQANATIVTCTIATTSSQDFQIASLTIGAGDTVGVSSLTITVPAS
jgi:hypothetical protein